MWKKYELSEMSLSSGITPIQKILHYRERVKYNHNFLYRMNEMAQFEQCFLINGLIFKCSENIIFLKLVVQQWIFLSLLMLCYNF